ncbi:hypothetical protein AEA09_18785 [Lysinibacillus contaminans]|uniref:Uncharacterized protein n=1 Tax=Lysinibacillus contaminans TaxID=1293441 RepID=A0ABR5JWD4_9BACI|nr:hypothetical protein [Lysinibacillus contaminans]KOS66267.1 hypothetical protein AEA09_18785 [Lysinibacillus contaminans]
MKNVKMFSKVLSILSVLALIFNMGSITTAKADTYYSFWKIESSQKNYTTENVGSWELAYKGTPAKRDGEYDTVSATIARSASVSGSIQLTKKAISGEVGIALSKEYSIGGSKNSAQLKKGEYIKGYVKQVASVSKVVQRKWEHMGGVNYKSGTTATAYVKKPTGVTIKIEYYKNGVKIRSTNEQPIDVDYYYIDNETNETIKLTEEEVNSLEETTEENEDFINYNPEEDETLGLELDQKIYREEI